MLLDAPALDFLGCNRVVLTTFMFLLVVLHRVRANRYAKGSWAFFQLHLVEWKHRSNEYCEHSGNLYGYRDKRIWMYGNCQRYHYLNSMGG